MATHIPLQKADFEMLACTSLTALVPSFGKNQISPLAPMDDFLLLRFLLCSKAGQRIRPWLVQRTKRLHDSLYSLRPRSSDCGSHTISLGKMNDLNLKLRVCPPPHKSATAQTLSAAAWSTAVSPRDFITIWLLFSAAYIQFIRSW